MATNTCTSCGCKKCGCSDNALITPAPCPTPAGCPDPIACSEYFDAECIVYSGLDIECNNEVVVETDTNLADALNNIITFFCEFITGPDLGSVVEVCDTNNYLDITSETDPLTGVTTYTICFDSTQLPVVALVSGTGIDVTSNVVGNITTYTVTNTDRGSLQNIFKNIAVAGQNTVIADSNNDTLTLAAGTGISITTIASSDTITITNTAPNVNQDLWKTINGDSGSTSANSPSDTLIIVGSKEISTSIIGDTVTINTWDYEIGQYVSTEGGVIFHRWLSTSPAGSPGNGTVQNYLVVDTSDLSTSAQWATLNVNISNVESTWDGLNNTTNLIAAGGAGGITAGTAAVLCNASTNNGKTDWYLPAIDELFKLYSNRWEVAQGLSAIGGTSLDKNAYWSSTEYDNQFSYYYAFGNGYSPIQTKVSAGTVRAVRRFFV
jgi:hypothetical protein